MAMANDIPSPRETSVERFRQAIRIHECGIEGCPYCLVRDWVNGLEAGIKTDQKKSNEGEKDRVLI